MAFFRTGYNIGEFLFEGVEVNTPGAFAGTFVGLVSTAILLEGLRIVRDFLLNRFTDARKELLARSIRAKGAARYSRTIRADPSINEEAHSLRPGDIAQNDEIEDGEDETETLRKNRQCVGDSSHPCSSRELCDIDVTNRKVVRFSDLILSSILHMIYITIGYTMMLAVMTFNVWVLVAVSIGIGLGYFVFGTWRRSDHLADLAVYRRTLIACESVPQNSHEGSSDKTASTNSDSANSMDAKLTGDGDGASSAQLMANVDVHCCSE